MTTHIQRLATEVAQLWDAINKSDCELIRLRGALSSANGSGVRERIEVLDAFFEEASSRVHQIEDYLMILSPTCTRDAVVLLSIATAIEKIPAGERYTNEQHKRMLPRILSEVLHFLEREADTTATALLGDAFGASGATWQDDLSKIAGSLPAAFPSEPAHTP